MIYVHVLRTARMARKGLYSKLIQIYTLINIEYVDILMHAFLYKYNNSCRMYVQIDKDILRIWIINSLIYVIFEYEYYNV